MYLTEHARHRLTQRLGVAGLDVGATLEEWPGERGTVVYLLADRVNGIVVAVAVDGSVETVYLRRPEQDMSTESFGLARKVVDLR
jgi:hypothetical protein